MAAKPSELHYSHLVYLLPHVSKKFVRCNKQIVSHDAYLFFVVQNNTYCCKQWMIKSLIFGLEVFEAWFHYYLCNTSPLQAENPNNTVDYCNLPILAVIKAEFIAGCSGLKLLSFAIVGPEGWKEEKGKRSKTSWTGCKLYRFIRCRITFLQDHLFFYIITKVFFRVEIVNELIKI